MIVIIKVINNKTQISLTERTIACVNDNETSYKEFQVPRYINDIDLADYSATIEIQPVNKDEIPYYDLVEKIVNEDSLVVKWIVKSHNTKDCGKLYFNLHFSKDNGISVPVYQTQKDYFSVAESVNAEQQSTIIPPSIFEQAVTEATRQAGIAEDSADISVEAKDIVVQKAGQVSVDKDEVNINAQQVSNDKLAIEGYKTSIEADKQTVVDDTAIVVAKAIEVNDNTTIVLQKAQQVTDNTQEVSTNTQTVATNTQMAIDKAAEALQSAANALVSEQNAHTSAENAANSETSALGAMQTAVQALTDLLAMLGSDVATLTGGKLTPSQIPPLSINGVFEVDSIEDMLQLTAERGDVALVLLDENIHDSYMLSTDEPSNLDDWKKLGVSYVANAGHAVTSDNAENANKINNKRLVAMTESQYDVAVKDENTFYAVTPD